MQNNDFPIEGDSIDLKKEFTYYLYYWPWFALSIILFLTAGIIYIKYSSDIYETAAAIQIEEDANDPSSMLTEGLGIDLYGSGPITIENDVAIIKSNRILGQVIEDLELQTTIYRHGIIKKNLVWGQQIPFEIAFLKGFDPEKVIDIELEIFKNYAQLTYEDVEKDILVSEKITFGKTFSDNYFTILIPNQEFTESRLYTIERKTLMLALDLLKQEFNVGINESLGETITMKLKGPNTTKNEAVINKVIEILEKDQITDKRFVFENTISFIENRLRILSKSIDTMQQESVAYRSRNKVFSPELQTGNALANIIKGEDEAFRLEMQLTLVNSLKERLEKKEAYTLLPVNIGIENSNINTLVTQYNTIVMERDALLTNSTEKNPLVRQLSNQLKRFKTNILANIGSYIQGITTSINRYAQLKNNTEREVSSLPSKESQLLNFARSFQITEGLYLFLLQRREEASISYESAISDIKVVDFAYSTVEPIMPKPKLILLGTVFFGALLPFVILFIIKILDNKIRSRKDLEEQTGLPIIGELPLIEDLETIKDPRSMIAESTRVLRTNLSFVVPPNIKNPIIISTSAAKGDGKTFVSFNLACSLSATGSKVLLIGADLRNPQLHKLLNTAQVQKGLSSYLINTEMDSIDEMLKQYPFSNNHFNVLLSGPIPPNPSELLINPRFKELLDNERKKYDYILIDCAPLMLVSDTVGILNLADVVVYNIRANKTDRSEIEYTQKIKVINNLKSLALVLNGVKHGPNSYYNYGYGYGYNADK